MQRESLTYRFVSENLFIYFFHKPSSVTKVGINSIWLRAILNSPIVKFQSLSSQSFLDWPSSVQSCPVRLKTEQVVCDSRYELTSKDPRRESMREGRRERRERQICR